jgi:hypothetical protein
VYLFGVVLAGFAFLDEVSGVVERDRLVETLTESLSDEGA